MGAQQSVEPYKNSAEYSRSFMIISNLLDIFLLQYCDSGRKHSVDFYDLNRAFSDRAASRGGDRPSRHIRELSL